MAKRFYSRYSLNIFTLELEEWKYPLHKHNFFELIFIKEGKGYHTLNGVKFSYQEGHIFLLSPEDEHFFEIGEKTIFEFVKFTEQLFVEKAGIQSKSNLQQKIESVLFSPNIYPGDIISIETDRPKLFRLLQILQEEFHAKGLYSRQIVLELYGAMMLIVARNLHKKNKGLKDLPTQETEKVSEILSYIRQHILEKDMVSLKAIASQFFMSENYISIYIKKHTDLSIKQLIIETKLKSAERLLKQSNFSVSEIATRLGFTDTSHFSKTFKKSKGISPSDFRR